MALSDALYNSLTNDINDVIDELGTTFTIRGEPVFDPDTLTASAGATRVVSGVITDYKFVKNYAVDANNKASKFLLLKAGSAPAHNEEVNVDGEWHKLDSVDVIKPADIVVCYILELVR